MRVLVLNAGSSSLKAALLDVAADRRLADAVAREVAEPAAALASVLRQIEVAVPGGLSRLDAIGHRIVHGAQLLRPVRVDDAVEAAIAASVPLAPLHNPPGLAALRAMRARFPMVPQVAVFDTAFHATLPPAASRYALPDEWVARLGLRRLGFHGINHAQVMRRCAATLGMAPCTSRLVSCHLGAGASVAAIAHGRCVDTSMGMTPLEGLVMGTRAGDLDPGIVLQLARAIPDPDELDVLLQRHSGLLALAGTTDMAEIERRARAGEARALAALEVYVHRLRRYLGAMCASMEGVDAIAFSGGIGEHATLLRELTCRGLGWIGAQFDPDANRSANVSHQAPVARISTPVSVVQLLVVAADEEREIALEVATLLSGGSRDEADRV
ncbi:MAG: acetate/propionate family kinase [Sinobacteraceae bacterium]|nr:acetate/propionate family kinase [Nevskiaceae bacterium]